MGKYKWVLFDADHTLFDFDKASSEALAEVFILHNIDWHEGQYPDYKRINRQCWLEHEQGVIDRDTLVYERFRRYFDFMRLDLDPVSTQQQYFSNLSKKPYLLPGADSILSLLKGRLNLGYITNGMKEVQRPRLESIGWDSLFDVIVIAGEIGCSKPHYDYFNFVHLAMDNPDKSQVLVVGDSLTADIEGAMAYGFDSCWYNPGREDCQTERRPHHMINHLDQLREILL